MPKSGKDKKIEVLFKGDNPEIKQIARDSALFQEEDIYGAYNNQQLKKMPPLVAHYMAEIDEQYKLLCKYKNNPKAKALKQIEIDRLIKRMETETGYSADHCEMGPYGDHGYGVYKLPVDRQQPEISAVQGAAAAPAVVPAFAAAKKKKKKKKARVDEVNVEEKHEELPHVEQAPEQPNPLVDQIKRLKIG